MMVLSRLLNPSDFGLIGMVTAFTGVLGIFTGFGLSAVAVQRATISNQEKSTLFWLNMLVGTTLGLLSLAGAPALVAFYREPRIFWVTIALACQFPLSAAAAQHYALLERQMRFVSLSMIEIICILVSTIFGIGMAIAGYGYWAIVGASISSVAVSTICAWLTTGWIPRMPSRVAGIGSMIRFGGTVTLNSLVVYVANNLEKALLGRFWGADALGLYGRAYQIINIPTDNLNLSIGGVAFSSLSRLQDDAGRFKIYFLKGYCLVLTMTLPITIACAMFSSDLVFVILGSKWQNAAVLVRLLSPTILIFALVNPLGWLLIATGRVGRSLKIVLVLAPMMILAYALGMRYGPKGVALALSALMTLWAIPHIMWCIHGTMISFQDLLRVASRPFLSAAVAAAFAFAVQFLYRQLPSPILRLILGASVMLGSYLWMLLNVMKQKSFYLDLIRGFRKPSVRF